MIVRRKRKSNLNKNCMFGLCNASKIILLKIFQNVSSCGSVIYSNFSKFSDLKTVCEKFKDG